MYSSIYNTGDGNGNRNSDGSVVVPISVIYQDENICCICLESCQKELCANLKCCKITIHDKCLFRIVLHNLHKCPICRRDMDIHNLFTDKVIHQYFESFSKQEQSRYTRVRNTLLLRYYSVYYSLIASSRSHAVRIFCVLMLICLFYICLFLILITFRNTTHTHTLPNTYNYDHNYDHNHNYNHNYNHNHNHNHNHNYPSPLGDVVEYNDVMD